MVLTGLLTRGATNLQFVETIVPVQLDETGVPVLEFLGMGLWLQEA